MKIVKMLLDGLKKLIKFYFSVLMMVLYLHMLLKIWIKLFRHLIVKRILKNKKPIKGIIMMVEIIMGKKMIMMMMDNNIIKDIILVIRGTRNLLINMLNIVMILSIRDNVSHQDIDFKNSLVGKLC